MSERGADHLKALTLLQPWASLVALGAKSVETRSWATKYRGPLAIHAGARRLHHGSFLLLARTARMAGLITLEQERVFRSLDVPFGAVVATCELVDVVAMVDLAWGDEPGWRHEVMRSGVDHVEHVYVGREQRPYGDFSPGRFAWLLGDVVALPEPVPARGGQRIWNWRPGQGDGGAAL